MKAVAVWLISYLILNLIVTADFYFGCERHIKNAGQTEDFQVAASELKLAVGYIERRGLTSGHTSVFKKSTDEDVGAWAASLKNSLEGLEEAAKHKPVNDKEIAKELDALLKALALASWEADYILILVDCDGPAPKGISRFPYNKLFVCGDVLTALLFGFWLWKRRQNHNQKIRRKC